MNTSKMYVHGGVFHTDDVACAAAVRLLNPKMVVERVFALPESLPEGALVCDVGGVWDGTTRFDHHQKAGGPPPRPNGCPRAAFGALWGSEWGRDVCGAVAGAEYHNLPLDAASRIRDRVDRDLVQGVDAQDCGWQATLRGECSQDGMAWHVEGWVGPKDGMPLPPDRPGQAMSLSSVISGFNPRWDENTPPMARDAFAKAVDLMEGVLRRTILSAAATIMAENIVLSASADGQVLVLPRFVPWQEAVLVRPDQGGLLYVVYPSLRGGFCVQQIPVRPGADEGRKPMPESWAGRRGKDLETTVGLEGQLGGDAPSVFCHPGRFLCGAETLGGALCLARAAIEA